MHITTGLPGFMTLSFLANFLFSIGIHPSGIVNPILEPPLIAAMNENTAAFAAGLVPPHIIVLPFRDLYGHLGGTGSTLALLLAVLVKSRISSHQKFARTVAVPSLFNINEPVIFGFPIVMNPLLIIPFIFYPMINYVIAYYVTAADLVGRIVVYTPWSVPPILSGYLGSGGDIRNSILQIILLGIGVVCYLPFLMAYERGMMRKKEQELAEDLVAHANANQDNAQVAPQASAAQEGQVPSSEEADISILNGKTVLLVCNEGMSTSMMAKRMQQHANKIGLETKVYAMSAANVESEYKKVDFILLGPQLAYMKGEIQDITQHSLPIEPINPGFFAKLDGEAALMQVAQII